MIGAMSDEHKKPDPIEDVRKGLGLLFRAARNAVDEIPTDKIEGAVKTGAREVTRVIETVTSTIEKELFPGHAKSAERPASQPPPAAAAPAQPSDAPKPPPDAVHATQASATAPAEAKASDAKPADAEAKKEEKPPIITPPPDGAS